MKGIVKRGLGQGEYWIKKLNPIFIEKNKMELFPGTLNIEIEEPYIIEDNYQIINGKEYGGTEEVLIKECVVLEEKAYIVRPKRNNAENGDHPLNIIEIISNINFREKYKLRDNDRIEIKI